LIKTDQAYQKIMERRPLPEIEQLLVSGNGAVADVQAARELVDRDHPVQIFLLQAQLAAYRNFTVAEFRLNNNATVPVEHRRAPTPTDNSTNSIGCAKRPASVRLW